MLLVLERIFIIADGTLTGNRTVSSGNFSLTFNPATTFDTTLTAANNASSLSIFGVNTLSYAAGFSANNIGALYGGLLYLICKHLLDQQLLHRQMLLQVGHL